MGQSLRVSKVILIISLAIGLIGCSNKAGTGAVVGGAGGAVVGGAAGGWGGAAIGAGVGALAGAAIGSILDSQDQENVKAHCRSTWNRIENDQCLRTKDIICLYNEADIRGDRVEKIKKLIERNGYCPGKLTPQARATLEANDVDARIINFLAEGTKSR